MIKLTTERIPIHPNDKSRRERAPAFHPSKQAPPIRTSHCQKMPASWVFSGIQIIPLEGGGDRRILFVDYCMLVTRPLHKVEAGLTWIVIIVHICLVVDVVLILIIFC